MNKNAHRWKFIGQVKNLHSTGTLWKWRCSKCGDLTSRSNPRTPSGKTQPSCNELAVKAVMES